MVFTMYKTPELNVDFLLSLLLNWTPSKQPGKYLEFFYKKLDRKCDRMVKTASKSDVRLAAASLAKVNFPGPISARLRLLIFVATPVKERKLSQLRAPQI